MKISERLYVSKILIEHFGRLLDEANAKTVDIPLVLAKARAAERKMRIFYLKWDRPSELLDQIQNMESIIKKLEKMQNNDVAEM